MRRWVGGIALVLLALLDVHAARAQQLEDRFWSVDGTVRTILATPNTIYLGGSFTSIIPRTGGGAPVDPVAGRTRPGSPHINGSVWAVVPDGAGGWFIGGEFDSVGGLPRANLARIQNSQGILSVGAWNPGTDGRVRSLAVNGTRVYIGGSFASVGGVARFNLAQVDLTSGAVAAWNPDPDGPVSAIRPIGAAVYVGGDFSRLGGSPRAFLGAVDLAGIAVPWSPEPNGTVRTLATGASGSGVLFVGGAFTTIGGADRNAIAALDVSTGQATAWDVGLSPFGPNVRTIVVIGGVVYFGGRFGPLFSGAPAHIAAVDELDGFPRFWTPTVGYWSIDPPDGEGIHALAVSSSTVYFSGAFSSAGGQSRDGLAAVDRSTGALSAWDPKPNGYVYTMATSGASVYLGGSFEQVGAVPRANLAALSRVTGAPTSWDPGASGPVLALAQQRGTIYAGGGFTTIGGQPRTNVAALDTLTGSATAWTAATDDSVRAIAVSGATVYIGGTFTSVSGQPRLGIGAVDTSSGAVASWDASADGGIYALVPEAGSLYVGGNFSRIGGQERAGIAQLDLVTARAMPWNPEDRIGNSFSSLATDENRVFAGVSTRAGPFFPSEHSVKQIDKGTGVLERHLPAPAQVRSVATGGGKLIFGGESFLDMVDLATGADLDVGAATAARTFALGVGSNLIYVGGRFDVSDHQSFLALRGIPKVALTAPSTGWTITVGDTASSEVPILNLGFEPLQVSSIEVPSGSISVEPPPPFTIAPGDTVALAVRFAPRDTTEDGSGPLRVHSNDPTEPIVNVPISFEALSLRVQTNPLVADEPVPLGQAVTAQVIPAVGHRVEGGTIFFRASQGIEFDRSTLVSIGSAFVGIIPGSAIREGGVEFYVQVENSGVFATDPPGAPADALFRLSVASPTSITAFARPTSRAEFVPDSAITVEVSLPDGTIVGPGAIYYRQGGELAFQDSPLGPSGRAGVQVGVIPGAVVGDRGVEYWVEQGTLTSTVPLTFPASEPSQRPEVIRTTLRGVTESAQHPGQRYRMLGIPLDYGENGVGLLDILSGQLGPYDPVQWRVFRYAPGAEINVELSHPDSASRFATFPGRGYWVVTRDAHRLGSGAVPGLSVATASAYPIVLARGWNQISNPYGFPVSWDAIEKPAEIPAPVAFDPALGPQGEYSTTPVTVLRPFEGYFVHNPLDHAVTVLVHPVATALVPAHAARAEVAEQVGGWRLGLRARTELAADGSNVVGVDPAASESADRQDLAKPPSVPGSWVRLALVPTWARSSADHLRQDMRAVAADGHTWNMEIRSAKAGEEIALELIPRSALPESLGVWLIDRESGVTVNLRTSDGSLEDYRVLSGGPARSYRLALMVGSREYISHAKTTNQAIPDRISLAPAAPNPSSGPTRFVFGLPSPQSVRLEIFNVAGQRVASLLENTIQSAGYHSLVWNGTTTRGSRAPGGVYFCRLTTSAGALTRRMVRID